MSGKEAMVFVVRCGGESRCAKVYKEADQRSFRQAVDYTENRKTKNSARDARYREADAVRQGIAGSGVAKRGGRRALPPRRRRCARAATVRLPRRRAADGARHRRRRQCGAASQRRRARAGRCALDLHERLVREVVRSALRGRRARRFERVQHPARRRRAGDHRSAASGRRRVATTTRSECCCATSTTCAGSSVSSRPALLETDFGNEIWARYQSGHADARRRAHRAACATDDAPVDLESVLGEIDAVRLEEAARQMRIRERE